MSPLLLPWKYSITTKRFYVISEEYRLNQQQYTKAGKTFRSLYESPDQVPENFIMQIAFTHKASFLLTTDGRVFSWGEGPTLGIEA